VAGVVRVISGRYPTRGYPGNGGQWLSRSTSAERPCVRRRKACPEGTAVILLTHPVTRTQPARSHPAARCGAVKYGKLSFRKIKWGLKPRTVPVRVMVESEVHAAVRRILNCISAAALAAIIARLLAEWMAEVAAG
jgi:hypothetical protein